MKSVSFEISNEILPKLWKFRQTPDIFFAMFGRKRRKQDRVRRKEMSFFFGLWGLGLGCAQGLVARVFKLSGSTLGHLYVTCGSISSGMNEIHVRSAIE